MVRSKKSSKKSPRQIILVLDCTCGLCLRLRKFNILYTSYKSDLLCNLLSIIVTYYKYKYFINTLVLSTIPTVTFAPRNFDTLD